MTAAKNTLSQDMLRVGSGRKANKEFD